MVGSPINGTGTKVYGKRDFRTDSSFVTTKWITFLWVPLVPLRSMRVKPIDTSGVDHLGGFYISGVPWLAGIEVVGKV
jgi:hypothetical protein